MTRARERDEVSLGGARYVLQDIVLPRDTIFNLMLRKLRSAELEATSEWIAFSYEAATDDDSSVNADASALYDPQAARYEEKISSFLGFSPFLYSVESMPRRRFKAVAQSQSRVKLPSGLFETADGWDTDDWFIRDLITVHFGQGTPIDRTLLKGLDIPPCDFVTFCKIKVDRTEITQIGEVELSEVILKPDDELGSRYSALRGRRPDTTWHQWWAALVVAAANGGVKAGLSAQEVRRALVSVLTVLQLKEIGPQRDHEQLNMLVNYLNQYKDNSC